MNVWADEQV
jgi:hypothetical protein